MIAIDTVPHVGVDMASGEPCEHDQDILLVDGREVGYLSHKPEHRPNLMLFALPMMVLYVFSIGVAWFFGKKRQEEPAV